jgi:uncharacterized protein with beta-barrel porin domain
MATLTLPATEGIEFLQDMASALFTRFAESRAAGAPVFDSAGIFVQAGDTFGTRKMPGGAPRASLERPFVFGGFEYVTDAANRMGVSVGYSDGTQKLDRGQGQSLAKSWSIQAFATTDFDGSAYVVEAVLGLSDLTSDLSRMIATGPTARPSPKGQTWAGAVKASRPFILDRNLTLAPYIQFDLTHARIDPFTESGGVLGWDVAQTSPSQGVSEVGVAASQPLARKWGVLTPRGEIGWRHGLISDGQLLMARQFGSASPSSIPIPMLADSAAFAASLTGSFVLGIDASLSYRGQIASGSRHSLALRVSAPF